MKASIVTIGEELLSGRVINTNAAYLGEKLSALGFRVVMQKSIPDDEGGISSAVREAVSLSDFTVVTGGLGPTPDDVTREGIARAFGVQLLFSKKHFSRLEKEYKKYGKKIPASVKKEASYPSNAEPLMNQVGIALGFYIQTRKKLLAALPGVPMELYKMTENDLLPLLKQHFPGLKKNIALNIRLSGLGESNIVSRLGERRIASLKGFGIYPGPGEAALVLQFFSAKQKAQWKDLLKKKFGASIYSWDGRTIAEEVVSRLLRRKKTVSVAESCTGGLVGAELTSVSGSSAVFPGGRVVYGATAKAALGVRMELIKKHGEVSSFVAKALAKRIRDDFESDFGIGISGIAGPAGGTPEKPVGLVYIAASASDRTICRSYRFWGSRAQVRSKSVQTALALLNSLI